MNSDQKIKKITRTNEDKLRLLVINEKFLKQVEDYRIKIGIPINGYNADSKGDVEKVEKLYKSESAIKIDERITTLLEEYNITENYRQAITIYFLYNKVAIIPTNFSIKPLRGRYINIEIYKKPTKEDWVVIKKSVDGLITASGKYKSLNKLNYPDGASVSRPKPKLKRILKILKKTKLLGQTIESTDLGDKEDRYSYADIEPEVFPEGKIDQSKRNIKNIRTTVSRYKRYIKGPT